MTRNKELDLSEIKNTINSFSKSFSRQSKEGRRKSINKAYDHFTQIICNIESTDFSELVDFFKLLEAEEMRHQIAAAIDPKDFFKLGKKLVAIKHGEIIAAYLDIFRSSEFLKKIYDQQKWPDLILELLHAGNYTFPKLFKHRAAKYSNKTLFSVLDAKKIRNYTWSQIESKVLLYARGLYALQKKSGERSKVAFLCKNSLEMALFDLACISSGITNIMIPVNSVAPHIEYILNRTKPTILIISQEEQLDKIHGFIKSTDFLRTTIVLKNSADNRDGILSLKKVEELSDLIDISEVEKNSENIRLNDLVSIMFTSGTTGNPKGIMFTQQNIVFKRFARAMALPEIGEKDCFLSYLPLYHTFGRWLEMTGSVFWAARYIFMENPSVEAMIASMRRVKPSIFISIPKKWYQLYEQIGQTVDLIKSSDEEIRKTVSNLTGGNLKWGLSAAGYLDPEIFQFFQRNGIELMSGFGMTEATGGITMTPPGNYVPNSLGKPLPGIYTKFAKDGELLIKGPYVMRGYVNPEESGNQLVDGWLPTGDVMRIDERGFIQIVDRKKEIYKNIKGETIAPQKIENYFREFDFIKHVFLVGDHKPFNTLLIYPNFEYEEINFSKMDNSELRTYFSSVIVSVNRFLAPFERIVDFVIIDRDFSADENELTPKGTFRRKVVEKNFAHYIKPLYERNYVSRKISSFEVYIPDWFLRERGLTAHEMKAENRTLFLRDSKYVLVIKPTKKAVQVGDFSYLIERKKIDFSILLVNPYLWVGNQSLVNFTGPGIFEWYHLDKSEDSVRVEKINRKPTVSRDLAQKLNSYVNNNEYNLEGIHNAFIMLQSGYMDDISLALDYLGRVSLESNLDVALLAQDILKRSIDFAPLKVQRRALCSLIPILVDREFEITVMRFLESKTTFLSPALIKSICQIGLSKEQLEIIFKITFVFCKTSARSCYALFNLLSRYGALHPTTYKIIRQFFATCQLSGFDKGIIKAAGEAIIELRDGFRNWLGPNRKVAVDIETGEEYTWQDVIIFEEDIDLGDKEKLAQAIENTSLIREAIFIFSKGILVRLHDIPAGGVWVSHLGTEHGKSVYRMTIQTRYQGSFDIAVNINQTLSYDGMQEEMNWLIQAGTAAAAKKLVEDYGGYWQDYDIWSEEFIPGETTGKFIKRMTRLKDEASHERVRSLWPFFIWGGIMDYIRFWIRTGKRMELQDPSPNNVIIPLHDYQTGSRIVSIAARRKHQNPLQFLTNLYTHFIKDVENRYQLLQGIGKPKYIFSAFLESMGEEKGIKFLERCLEIIKKEKLPKELNFLKKELIFYIASVKKSGFIPRKLYFAIKRYHRWLDLNKNATLQARGATLSELYGTYELDVLEAEYPETRTRFFINTVFTKSSREFTGGLENVIKYQKLHNLNIDDFRQHISALHKILTLSKEELYFLLRLTYPHLSPTDSADIISLESGGTVQSDIDVQMVDNEGNIFHIRSPITPKEIARLQQLFITNNLPVQFKSEHRYILAINERGQLIGGLFYKPTERDVIHIEKIVVSNFYRKKGVSDSILNEFFKRMRAENYQFVTTGFFRPEYFYRFGFKIERKYAGLVKNLKEESAPVY
jgi:long-subunit acyl-CoA synthetase (AMP-forming)/N-acetylglutamate synthase-like GNAT family acetyltransferase